MHHHSVERDIIHIIGFYASFLFISLFPPQPSLPFPDKVLALYALPL
jgi:hypothetical protein